MPWFEFRCGKCGAVKESQKHDARLKCDKCVIRGYMKRVYSVSGIHFKGSGFAKND